MPSTIFPDLLLIPALQNHLILLEETLNGLSAELSSKAVPQNKDMGITSIKPTDSHYREPVDNSKRDDGPVAPGIRFKRIKSESDLEFQKKKEAYYTPFAKLRKLSVDEYIKELDQYSQDLAKDTEVCMRIKPQVLKRVLANSDRFKSQFETKTSNGTLDLEARRISEKEHLGNYNPDLPDKSRMIYGYIAKKNNLLGEYDPWLERYTLDQYGDVTIVFKDDVKRRTSFIMGDSLAYSNCRAVPLENPNGDCFPLEHPRRIQKDVEQLGFSRVIKALDPLNEEFNDVFPYIEAQIHYGAHPKDIKKVILTGPDSKDEKLIQLLQAGSIPLEILAVDFKRLYPD